jgi:hypothetical protein
VLFRHYLRMNVETNMPGDIGSLCQQTHLACWQEMRVIVTVIGRVRVMVTVIPGEPLLSRLEDARRRNDAALGRAPDQRHRLPQAVHLQEFQDYLLQPGHSARRLHLHRNGTFDWMSLLQPLLTADK